jgi:hypothetical protein
VGDKKPTLTEIAARIRAHLKRFEADPAINKLDPHYRTRTYYCVNAYRGGRYVSVSYVNYQGATALERERAERYLAWLDAGNVGTHWECEKQEARRG